MAEHVVRPPPAGEFPYYRLLHKHFIFIRQLLERHVSQFKGQQPRHVDVVDPKERHAVGDIVQRYSDVNCHDVSRTGAECRIEIDAVFVHGHATPFGLPKHVTHVIRVAHDVRGARLSF